MSNFSLDIHTSRPHAKWRKLPWQRVMSILVGAARGLAAVHEKGITHLDVAARNILLDGDWTAKVSDFGLSHKKSEQQRRHDCAKDTGISTFKRWRENNYVLQNTNCF